MRVRSTFHLPGRILSTLAVTFAAIAPPPTQGSQAGQGFRLYVAHGIDQSGRLRPRDRSDRATHRTARLSSDPPPFAYRSIMLLGGGKAGQPSLDSVWTLAASPDGGAFLLGASGDKLLRLAPDGKVALELSGDAMGGKARAVAPLPDGTFAVSLYAEDDRLQRFDAQGRRCAPLHLPDSNDPMRSVSDMQLGRDGTLYVLDYIAARVHRLRLEGALPSLSLPEARRTSFSGVQTRLAVSGDSLYVGGTGPELLRYRLDGAFVGRVPMAHWPQDIACDEQGNLLMVATRETREFASAPRILYRASPVGRVISVWEPVRGLTQGELAGDPQISLGPGGVLFTLELQGPEGGVPGFPARLQKWVPSAPALSPFRVIRDETPHERAPEVLRRILSTRLGKRLGRLSAPVVDDRGRVYLGETTVDPSTQTARPRVLRFSSRGTLVESLGEGTFRNLGGYPASIAAVCVDRRNGSVFAAGDTEHLIRVFDSRGRVRRTLPLPPGYKNQTWVAKPLSLTSLPGGRLMMPDDDRSQLWVYHPAANSWRSVGNWGQGPSEFHMPVGVSANQAGDLYVADTMNMRVLRYDSSLRYRYEIRRQNDMPWDVAAGPDGGCVVGYDAGICRYDGQGKLVWFWPAPQLQSRFGAGWGTGGAVREGGLAIAPDGTVYVAARLRDDDPNTPSFMLMVLGTRLPEGSQGRRLRVVSQQGPDALRGPAATTGLEFSTVELTPLGLCIGSAILGRHGPPLRTFPPQRAEGRAAGSPAHIADACWIDGRLVMLELPPKGKEGEVALIVYDRQGTLEGVHPIPIHYGSDGWSLGGVPPENIPPQMAARGGSLFISSPNRGEVLECDLRGTVRRRLGVGLLHRPIGVAVGPGPEVYVADSARHRVEVFTPEGEHLRSLGGPGREALLHPSSLAMGPNRTLYVVDQAAGEVLRLTLRGTLVSRSETIGGANLTRIAVDKTGTVYLAGDRLRILRLRGRPSR